MHINLFKNHSWEGAQVSHTYTFSVKAHKKTFSFIHFQENKGERPH